jgi:hypothetical protein
MQFYRESARTMIVRATMKQPLAAFLVFSLTLAQASAQSHFELLETGAFHGQDVRLRQPASWVGIYCKDDICTARPTTVHSTRVPDPLGEDEPNKPTGTLIQVSTQGQPLFLVRGISSSPRPIATVFAGELSLQAGDKPDIAFSGTNYTLRVDGEKTAKNTLPQGSRLLLSSRSAIQELFSVPDHGNDPYVTVLWIGDLDGDGKPDFYLNSSSHYNVSHKVLWLSTLAKPGQPVGQAAVFETAGC